ncbi:MAG: RNA polymerase sigma factor [Candidatus Omnitrophica bacterium]|nr:RNA polymerase sigma factor [Candidatus Omnitrophota bacterium]MDD5592041.1 RNA polymerase sigma factor [Candidatus Omnitrophota bacterium]
MDDLEFVQKCAKGDKRAWDEFIDKYSRLIYNYIHSVLKIQGSSFTQENLNDIFQEIILSLVKDNFRKLSSFKARNGASLASWLRQVTVNFTISYTRRLKSVISIDEEDDKGFSLTEILSSNSPSAADTYNQQERLVHLKDCIDKLENNDKYFLELHIHRGLNLEELRAYFKVSRGAIDMRKSRILERLRECFRDKGFMLDC